jgi:hypothetical protein
MSSILAQNQSNLFYHKDIPESIFIEKATELALDALRNAQESYKIDINETKELKTIIAKFLKFTLKGVKPELRLKRLLETSHDFVPLFLPKEFRRAFKVNITINAFKEFFDISIDEQNQRLRFFGKSNKEFSGVKQVELWSDARRDSSNLANYWVERFFDKISFEKLDKEIESKTGRKFKHSMNPLRESRQNLDSLHVMIACVAMILVGGKEEDPLSPILAIAKIYHEYLYYLNSIVDNKHGVHPKNQNYSSKIKDYALVSNLVFGHLKKYLKELDQVSLLNHEQFQELDDMLDDLNQKMMVIFFQDVNSDITRYFEQDYLPEEQDIIIQEWSDHAVEMTACWTEFFALMGSISANENYKLICGEKTIRSFGRLWGYGQLINGFKDFVVQSATADDVREKRCTPQLLHLLFKSTKNQEDSIWIKKTILSASSLVRDLTAEEKNKFVELFNKYNTFNFIYSKVDVAIDKFWGVYSTDTSLQGFLQQNNLHLKTRDMINGGIQGFFKDSRYLPKLTK